MLPKAYLQQAKRQGFKLFEMPSLDDLLVWESKRYRWGKKTFRHSLGPHRRIAFFRVNR